MPLAVRCRPIAAPLRRAVTLVAATSLAVGTAVLAAPAAQAADTVTPLPGVAGVADVATGGGRILVAAVDRLVIADSAGTVTGSLTLPGAYGIAPIPGTSRAYVSLRDTNQVAEVDVARRRIVRRIDLGATHPCPSEVVLSGGRVWVGYGCGSWGGGVLSVDAAAKTPVPVEVETGLYGAPSLAVANNVLAYGERGLSPATARVRTVGVNGATTLRGTVPPNWGDASNLGDLALSPDGTLLVLAAGAPYRHVGYDTTTLAEVRSYGDFDPYPNSVAFSPDGRQLAAGRNGEPEVTVYDTATAAARAEGNVTYPLELVPATLAFSGADVVGAVRNWSANTYFLWMVKGATLPGSAIAVTAPEGGGTALEPLTLTGRLTGADGSPLGAQQLTVTRQQEATGAAVALPAVTTAADGSFRITDTPPVGGDATYKVAWAGTSAYRGSEGGTVVPVAKRPSQVTLTGPETGAAGEPLTFTGRVTVDGGAPANPAPAQLYRTVSNNRRQSTDFVGEVALAADGSFTVTDTPSEGGQYVYTVYWYGSSVYEGNNASHSLNVSSTASAITGLVDWPAYVGEPYIVAGGISFDVGECTGPTTLHVRRQVGDGPEEQRADITTDEVCSFRFTDTVATSGGVRYTVSWDGDGTHQPASTDIFGWVDKQPATLTADAADYYLRPGQRVEITGTLAGARTGPLAGQQVNVTRWNPDGNATVLGPVTTSRTGTFVLRDAPPRVDPYLSFRYELTWVPADDTYDPATTEVTVYVTPSG